MTNTLDFTNLGISECNEKDSVDNEPSEKQLFENREVLDLSGLAALLLISTRTASRLIKSKKIPKVMVGDKPRFIKSDVIDALRSK